MPLAHFAQARRADLLAGLDQHLEVEAEPAARLDRRVDRGEVDRVLALVVRRPPAVEPLAFGRERPRGETGAPLRFLAADHVAVPVGEDRDCRRILDALGEQERAAAGRGVVQDPAAKAEPLEARLHLAGQVARELGRPIRVLALGRDRDAAPEIGGEAAVVEVALDAPNRLVAAHQFLPSGAVTSRMPSPSRLIASTSANSAAPGIAISQALKNM